VGAVFSGFHIDQMEVALIYLTFACCYSLAWFVAAFTSMLLKSRDGSHTLGYAIFQAHLMMIIYGVNLEFLWPTKINIAPIFDTYSAYAHIMCSIAILVYIKLYLKSIPETSIVERARRILFYFSCAELLLLFVNPKIALLANLGLAPFVVAIVGVGIVNSFEFGKFTGISFLIGWIFLLVSVLGYLLKKFGVTESSFLANYGIFLGSIIEMITIGATTIQVLLYRSREAEKRADDLQEAAVRTHRLTEMGDLMGSIAHEINNPLAIIMSTTSNLKFVIENRPIDEHKVSEFIEKIYQTVRRINHTVQSMMLLVRDGRIGDMIQTNLGECVQPVIHLMTNKFKQSGVVLQIDEIPRIEMHCNPTLISQGFLNILNNALDVASASDEKWVRVHFGAGDGVVSIKVKNGGPKLDLALKEKIFQPYYTTKPIGKGTGLGLSVSREIFEKHGGTVKVDLTEKANTTFLIELPSVKQAEKPVTAAG
jgi:signal transduction histidine kinase